MLFWDGEIHKTTLSSASWRALLLRAGFICAFFSLGCEDKGDVEPKCVQGLQFEETFHDESTDCGLDGYLEDTSAARDTLKSRLLSAGYANVPWYELELNRTLRSTSFLLGGASTGFRWNEGDGETSCWFPQGITTPYAADVGAARASDWVVVSWYHGNPGSVDCYTGGVIKGTRLSFVNLSENQYRHVLLVNASEDETGFYSLVDRQGDDSWHAGGIAWVDNFIYVAGQGLRVFDVRDIMSVDDDGSDTELGFFGDAAFAHNYDYVIPQLADYNLSTLEGSPYSELGCKPYSSSFAALDHTPEGDTQRLLIGQWTKDEEVSSFSTWNIKADGFLETDTVEVHRIKGTYGAPLHFQGALEYSGATFYTSNGDGSCPSVQVLRIGCSRSFKVDAFRGMEDLTYNPTTDLLWTLSEWEDGRKDGRKVYAYPMSVFDGCGE